MIKTLLNKIRYYIPHNSLPRLWYTRVRQLVSWLKCNKSDIAKLNLIGVTGTDGKTTTTEMIAYILQTLNVPYASSTSLETKINGRRIASSKRTTPSLASLCRFLTQAKNAGAKVVVIEVSSHAIAQWRIFGLKFDVATLTNITHEHLNFHKTVEHYANTKKLLFTTYLKDSGVAILPSFDSWGARWKDNLPNCKTYDKPEVLNTEHGNTVTFKYAHDTYTLPMPGMHNALDAIAAALSVSSANIGISTKEALMALSNFPGVPGRMQIVAEQACRKLGIKVIVDFALTQKAMEESLTTMRSLAGKNGRIFVVFGATGGQHDTTVRPGLCKSVAKLADIAIVTDDEPYESDPADIRKELCNLVLQNNATIDCHNIADRQKAIDFAIKNASVGDVVLISGMGHYTSRTVNGKEVPWNDAQAVETSLKSLQNTV